MTGKDVFCTHTDLITQHSKGPVSFLAEKGEHKVKAKQ